jgi:hypothetical protein
MGMDWPILTFLKEINGKKRMGELWVDWNGRIEIFNEMEIMHAREGIEMGEMENKFKFI